MTNPNPLRRSLIRSIFLAHGFTIKDGHDDLKPYVYEAAEALLNAVFPAPGAAEEHRAQIEHLLHDIVESFQRDGTINYRVSAGKELMFSNLIGACAHRLNIPVRPAARTPLVDMTLLELERAEWRHIGNTLRQCQEMLEKDGCRHSWIDPARNIATERADSPLPKGEPVNEQHEKEMEAVLAERDAREETINAILDEVLGADRPEWSSAYDYSDAIRDVQERMAALTPAEPAPTYHQPLGVDPNRVRVDPQTGYVSFPDSDAIQLIGIKDGKETVIGTGTITPLMKARDLIREMWGAWEDDDGSDADMAYGVCESLIQWMDRHPQVIKVTAPAAQKDQQ